MSKAKKIKVIDDKKGLVEIGTLSKNELCRGVESLMTQGQQLQRQLIATSNTYGNHLASWDALSSQEMVVLSNYHKMQ